MVSVLNRLERLFRGRDGPVDVGIRVGGGDEGRLELRWRQIDPLIQHGMEELVEALRVGRL